MNPTPPDSKEAHRKAATDFYKFLYSTNQSDLTNLTASSYTEHQISAGFTLAGLKNYAANRLQTISNHTLIIHRTLVQGNLVGLHMEEKITSDSSVARMALIRFDDNGKIIEHWEAFQGEPSTSANPNT
ncbi:MAG: hypothetical protein H7282_05160, partial [Cytophagaceae bacterium]|nr:hypothetical protein [Cytophagaceae bacterium]